jgi:Zn-finger nucleic acid-binding protein
VTTGEWMQLGSLMKILEAERWLKGTNFREVAFLQRRQDESDAGAPHPRARKVEGRDA